MKQNQDIRTIHIGMRTLHLIEGLTIKKYIPEDIMSNVHMALADQNMKWEDDVIAKCTMVITHGKYVSVMYEHQPIRSNGLLLFTFCQDAKKGHCFGFPKKWKHIEYYTRLK
ncbi:hypothetical protein [Euzebyella saccharophila]|uniref:Uncharacterized protein n=1 Tax=Euzebyella saccharophila TaxID=679664 RepID=A0ABV8JMN1_9FLAO|nr:hypothetical protein [Euzebyella saccharophila]